MDGLKGHPYVKSPIDIACWDILGKVTGQSVVTLLGGRCGEEYDLYRAISQGTAEGGNEGIGRTIPKRGVSQVSAQSWWESLRGYLILESKLACNI